MRDGPQFTYVRYDYFVAELFQLFADPERVDAGLHRHTRRRQILEPLLDPLRCGPETTSVDDFAVLVERAVMAPDIAKIDTNRQLGLGLPVELPR